MDRKQKEREYFGKHAEIFKKLKLASPTFTLKMAFYEKGRFGRNIQLYESELKKNEDIYMEFVDVVRDEKGSEQDYNPMYEDRPLFKFKANPFYAEEYELRERAGGYSAYIISASELMMVQEDGTEISYALYEKRREELKKQEESLPRLQKTLSVFPDFEQEFEKRDEGVKTSGSDFDIDKITDTSTLANISLRDFAAIMLVKPVSDKEWLNELIKQTKSEI